MIEKLNDRMTKTFYSNGKLLLTSEYAVLDGAKALAMPTRYGQSLTVTPKPNAEKKIVWKSYNNLGEVWFQDEFIQSKKGELVSTSKSEVAWRLSKICNSILQFNPRFLSQNEGCLVETHQDFNRLWGLGTSSTLINNLANWAEVDAFDLLDITFGGSGYDVACAMHNSPICYQRTDHSRAIVPLRFQPQFKDQLYFVYLNQKQNSRAGISVYKSLKKIDSNILSELSAITQLVVNCSTLKDFNRLLDNHESIVSKLIDAVPVKQRLFNDFSGSIKSLGAWGGDFVLVTSENDPTSYFKAKGYTTIITYDAMVL